MKDTIIVKGAREHNLKNINLEIPKNKLVVFTGVSGSGKSSLAFDTIYAEGQRRYVESLSSYARQFLGIMSKPDVDFIEGLSPSISIDQKSVSRNPRSTVGTVTEIYDYLRLLYARVGHPHCPKCNTEIVKLSVDEIVQKILHQIDENLQSEKIKPHKFTIVSPIVKERKGEFSGLFTNLKAKGFSEVIIDGIPHLLEDDLILIKTNKHTIDCVVDHFSLQYRDLKNPVFRANFKSRLFHSVEQALNLSDGRVIVSHQKQHTLYCEKFSCPNCNLSLPEIEPRIFSFNSPLGACEQCKGLGYVSRIDPDLLINPHLSINEGGIIPFAMVFYHETWFARLLSCFLQDAQIDPGTPLSQMSEKQRKLLLYGNQKIYKVLGKNRFGASTAIFEPFRGVVHELEKRYSETDSEYARFEIEKYMHEKRCEECDGKRLKSEVLGVTIENKNIYDIGELSIIDIIVFIKDAVGKISSYEKEISDAIINEIINRLLFLKNVGLSYLTLNRTSRTLSGGESQRIRLASQIGSGLTGVIYVLDEPSIGLHPKDVSALVVNLKNLRDLGNTIIVVEHDQETIEAADHIVDFGPYAGKKGGSVVATGSVADIKNNNHSLTGQYLSGKRIIASYETRGLPYQKNSGMLTVIGATQYNLKNITVHFPLGNLICVSGVSGSGKSTLVVETLYPALQSYLTNNPHKNFFKDLKGYQYLDSVYLVDQSSIGRTPRSNPATYLGVFDHIREVFANTVDARSRGYKKGRFSFNVRGGRCEKCAGAGTIKIEMHFLPDVYVTCDVCGGRRYNSETLGVQYKDKRIDEVLSFTVDEALTFFANYPHIVRKLQTLHDVGLGYLEMGQPAPTLSGGEAQRIKLAFELSKKDSGRTLYILDEPTTGLHSYDIEKLIQTLYQLIARGNTIIIIEHNLEVIKNCHHIIDLGPHGGEEGGDVLFQGPVKDIYSHSESYTGRYLKNHAA